MNAPGLQSAISGGIGPHLSPRVYVTNASRLVATAPLLATNPGEWLCQNKLPRSPPMASVAIGSSTCHPPEIARKRNLVSNFPQPDIWPACYLRVVAFTVAGEWAPQNPDRRNVRMPHCAAHKRRQPGRIRIRVSQNWSGLHVATLPRRSNLSSIAILVLQDTL